MNRRFKTYIAVLCCLLAIKSMALSSHFVVCDFDSESNIEMLHSQKIAHAHESEAHVTEEAFHITTSCRDTSDELRYSECTPCSDTYITQEVTVSEKRSHIEIDFTFCTVSVNKINTPASILPDRIIEDTDFKTDTYHPTITVLRI
jgi:hypothetical protein